MTTRPTSTLEWVAYLGLLAGLSLIQLNIFAYAPIVIGGVIWLGMAIRDRRWPQVPAFFWPLVALAVWTLVSAACSANPGDSLFRSRQLGYYLIVPFTMAVARGPRAMTIVNSIIAVGAASALWGIVQYAIRGWDTINHRPSGLLGHYMTYSGVLMLVASMAIARLVFRGREWVWPAVAVPALLVALAATSSRNAYAGALAAVVVLLLLANWRLLIALPVLLVVAAVVAPASMRDRAVSTFNLQDTTNRDRVSMWKSGLAMIADHPIFGVGPNRVPIEYLAKYKRPDAVDPPEAATIKVDREKLQQGILTKEEGPLTRAHLHNVPVQLAAERGLPALLAWLAFVILAARDLFKQARRGPWKGLAAGGLAALAAAVVAGLFEHNFGDTEFLVLFLGTLTLPFAAAAGEESRES